MEEKIIKKCVSKAPAKKPVAKSSAKKACRSVNKATKSFTIFELREYGSKLFDSKNKKFNSLIDAVARELNKDNYSVKDNVLTLNNKYLATLNKGNYKLKRNYTYPYEKESQLQKLHAYSSHNKKLIDTADKCYCFYCKSSMQKDEIKNYIDDGQTALCPKCEIDAIIPDSIDDTVDEQMISEMNEYWF